MNESIFKVVKRVTYIKDEIEIEEYAVLMHGREICTCDRRDIEQLSTIINQALNDRRI